MFVGYERILLLLLLHYLTHAIINHTLYNTSEDVDITSQSFGDELQYVWLFSS